LRQWSRALLAQPAEEGAPWVYAPTVNAVHLVAANGAVDLVVASATSDVHNCAR
jgi:hypothetical protein